MLKEKEQFKKKRRRGSIKCTPLPPKMTNTYDVGVSYPGSNLLTFIVIAHQVSFLEDEVSFWNINEKGELQFSAKFKHPLYVILASSEEEIDEGLEK